jgi:hypothetical protein
MAPLAGLRDELYQEMLSHIKQTDVSVPYRDGAWWYYSRTEEGLQYAIHCRKAGPPGDAPEASHPRRQPARRGPQPSWPSATPTSPTTAAGSPTASTTPASASTPCTSRIWPPAKPWKETVERVGSIVWAADTATLFYTVEDEEQKRQYQLWRHTLGTAARRRRARLRRPDERFNLGAGRTRDGKFLVMEAASHTTTESRFLAADNPTANGPWSPSAKTSTNTPSTTATASGSSAPTTRAATSASSPRPSQLPAAKHWTSAPRPPHRHHARRHRPLSRLSCRLRTRRRPAPPAPLELSPRTTAPSSPMRSPFPSRSTAPHPHINREFDTRPSSATPTSRW